ncbi:uncharacterized protein CMU_033090 [Cryptosporidium muris RN66]|uniref:CWF21 domain-containing protein n=1 Tax=Cryptosporidium muris (strain RN66) TaxID=441375 RepID=B6AFD3_CRYMR|nr:uncharacterized protein CMU_033090 [Cryptosporidium muris RN66]EEA06924.1 hypothetical protein, conserved [Cryptosporidium muris RN66]|eukprot:XP_002141273.1 hypothetical protein [Cryptosporidium muris RN66]
MYNGIGLATARGSGTSGYIQKNLSFYKPRSNFERNNNFLTTKLSIKPDPDLLEHQRLRQIELEVVLYLEKLSAGGLTGEELENKVSQKRNELMKKFNNSAHIDCKDINEIVNLDAHQQAYIKEQELHKFREALKINEDGSLRNNLFAKKQNNNKKSDECDIELVKPSKYSSGKQNKKGRYFKYYDYSPRDTIANFNSNEQYYTKSGKRSNYGSYYNCNATNGNMEEVRINNDSESSCGYTAPDSYGRNKNRRGHKGRNIYNLYSDHCESISHMRRHRYRRRRSRSPSTVSRYRSLSRSL